VRNPEILPHHLKPRLIRRRSPRKDNLTPYIGPTCVLDRPFHDLFGRHHVLILIANKVAFLHLTKSQPLFLNQIIKDIIETRECRILRAERFNNELPIVEDENGWAQLFYGRLLREPKGDTLTTRGQSSH